MKTEEKEKLNKFCKDKIAEFMEGDKTFTAYGPYLRKDGRKHVIIINKDNNGIETSRRTVSYPKLMAEILLDGDVWGDQTVDHVDRDFSNDNFNNLQILTLAEHASIDALRVKVSNVECLTCKTSFTPSVAQRNDNTRKIKKAGPFCSRKCSGIYCADVQNGKERLERTEIIKTYYFKDK
jgi:hypothetical protein